MRAVHPDARVLLAAVAALLCALAAAAAAPSLPDIQLGGDPAPPAAEAPQRQTVTPPEPTWVTDPLAPPSLLRDAR